MNTTRLVEAAPGKARRKRKPAPCKTSRGLAALCPDGLYRVDQFVPSIVGIGKSSWWAGVKEGKFPAPVVQRPRMTLWRGRDVLYAVAQLGSSA